jgi:hypothetical protein
LADAINGDLLGRKFAAATGNGFHVQACLSRDEDITTVS